jgi:hypothetical protein
MYSPYASILHADTVSPKRVLEALAVHDPTLQAASEALEELSPSVNLDADASMGETGHDEDGLEEKLSEMEKRLRKFETSSAVSIQFYSNAPIADLLAPTPSSQPNGTSISGYQYDSCFHHVATWLGKVNVRSMAATSYRSVVDAWPLLVLLVSSYMHSGRMRGQVPHWTF